LGVEIPLSFCVDVESKKCQKSFG